MTLTRVIFGPSKMLSLHVIEWGCEIAETLQIPIDNKVLKARWAKHHGNMYRSSLVVCVKVQSEMPVFHKIHHVIVHGRLLLVTFVLSTSFSSSAKSSRACSTSTPSLNSCLDLISRATRKNGSTVARMSYGITASRHSISSQWITL